MREEMEKSVQMLMYAILLPHVFEKGFEIAYQKKKKKIYMPYSQALRKHKQRTEKLKRR